MDIKLVVALIGLTGVAASALIQFYLGKLASLSKKAIDLKGTAYVDLVQAVSSIAASSKAGKGRNAAQFEKLTDAKTRVIMFGSDKVILKFNEFFVKYGVLDNEGAANSFSSMVSEMKRDISGKHGLSDKLLQEALFGKEIPV